MVGVTALLPWQSGKISSVGLKGIGIELRRDQVAGSVEGPRHFDVFRAPVSGTVVRTNGELSTNPGLLNKDPYGAGWFMEIKPSHPDEIEFLVRLPSGSEQISSRLRELKVHCFAEFPDYEMFEIGTECSAVLAKLDDLMDVSPSGTVVHLVSDDSTAPIEMERWSDRTGNKVLEWRKEGNLHHFIAKKS